MDRIALIGFGEAASTFASAAEWGNRASAFDIDPNRSACMDQLDIVAADSAADALRSATIVLSLVTADAAVSAAETYSANLHKGALWCDMNSVCPQSKKAAAKAVTAAGGKYVDVAVMAPVKPAALAVPLLCAGPHSDTAIERLKAIGFDNALAVGEQIGRAAAIKMIRSVMVKGIEALTDEMVAAAQAADVTADVFASLDASRNDAPWKVRAAYNLERMKTHGLRRAAEMEEATRTLRDLGIAPIMTEGTIRRQREAAAPLLSKRDAA